MSMTRTVLKNKISQMTEPAVMQGYIVDADGKEVRITSKMIQMTCRQLLKKCRSIKAA